LAQYNANNLQQQQANAYQSQANYYDRVGHPQPMPLNITPVTPYRGDIRTLNGTSYYNGDGTSTFRGTVY